MCGKEGMGACMAGQEANCGGGQGTPGSQSVGGLESRTGGLSQWSEFLGTIHTAAVPDPSSSQGPRSRCCGE